MTRATGKQLGPALVLGSVGLFAGFALFMTLFAAPARRADSCDQLAEFMEPRLTIVERRAEEHLAGVDDTASWRQGADELADIYFAFGRDLSNRKLLSPDDARISRDASYIGASATDLGERLVRLDGSLANADKLSAATAELRSDIARARRHCQ